MLQHSSVGDGDGTGVGTGVVTIDPGTPTKLGLADGLLDGAFVGMDMHTPQHCSTIFVPSRTIVQRSRPS